MPAPNSSATKYFKDKRGVEKCWARFISEIKAGRMLDGWGWSEEIVSWFLGRSFYKIPCGAVPKKSKSVREDSPQLQQSFENKGLGELCLSKHIRSVHLLYRKGKTTIAGRLVY